MLHASCSQQGSALSKQQQQTSYAPHLPFSSGLLDSAVYMQSPPKEWQAALQRAQAINPLRKSPHSKEDFDLDALLDAENRRRLELVRCILLQF